MLNKIQGKITFDTMQCDLLKCSFETVYLNLQMNIKVIEVCTVLKNKLKNMCQWLNRLMIVQSKVMHITFRRSEYSYWGLWVLKKQGVRVLTGFIWLRTGSNGEQKWTSDSRWEI